MTISSESKEEQTSKRRGFIDYTKLIDMRLRREIKGNNILLSYAGEIERWLQNAEAQARNACSNLTGVEPMTEALVTDIEAHIQQPKQRSMRRSFKHHSEETATTESRYCCRKIFEIFVDIIYTILTIL